MSKILIIRFSALGDVAMTIPVIYSFSNKYKEHDITILSESSLKPLFANMPKNVHFMGLDLKDKHAGLLAIRKFYVDELKPMKFDYVADFHSVLRSHFISLSFRLDGVKTAVINKGRIEKAHLTRKNNKSFLQLKSNFTRYKNVLEKLGFNFELKFNSLFKEIPTEVETILTQFPPKNGDKWIGIAPFAKHKGKIYPLELQEEVIAYFANQPGVKVIIFGGGKYEKGIINAWIEKYPTVLTTVGKFNLNQEIVLMSQLDLMLSMDSANMHLASLVNTKVISIWGATHPFAGFMGWNQSLDNALQVDLSCRPCSIYGKKECFRKDYACMYQIKPSDVISKIEKSLTK